MQEAQMLQGKRSVGRDYNENVQMNNASFFLWPLGLEATWPDAASRLVLGISSKKSARVALALALFWIFDIFEFLNDNAIYIQIGPHEKL